MAVARVSSRVHASANVNVALDTGALYGFLFAEDGPVVAKLLARALTVQRTAMRLCPVDTGRLRSSISVGLGREDDGTPYAFVGTNLEYAIYVELGTWKMNARPFLRPALGAATTGNIGGVVAATQIANAFGGHGGRGATTRVRG